MMTSLWEWLNRRVNKVGDMEGVLWEELFSQLTLIEIIDK